MSLQTRHHWIEQAVVTAEQMSAIESRLFEAQMPVAALMEKVAGLITQQFMQRYPRDRYPSVGVLVGPGHNGGDALVVARELHLNGYQVLRFQPFSKTKDLTHCHACYADYLGIPSTSSVEQLQACNVIVDGLFGFGLSRSLEGAIAAAVDHVNDWAQPVFSIDLPSGIHTDTGAVLGTAIRANYTVCLGLWKRAFLQDDALDYIGQAELIDFGLPAADIQAVLGELPDVLRITPSLVKAGLPLPRAAATYKYKEGHLLIICGSRSYSGAALLTAHSARASGVGMLSVAVPQSLKPLLTLQVPDALVIGCPETENGAIAQLPDSLSLDQYDAIACGPGLTLDAEPVIQQVLHAAVPLVLDADGLNGLAKQGTIETLAQRQASTLLTPHAGEFKRLFPDIAQQNGDRIASVQRAAEVSGAIVLLKGAKSAIAFRQHDGQIRTWLNPESTPALARGGSGDVLTGLMGGLLAQGCCKGIAPERVAIAAAAWHAKAGQLAAAERTELGVDASTLIQFLAPAIVEYTANPV